MFLKLLIFLKNNKESYFQEIIRIQLKIKTYLRRAKQTIEKKHELLREYQFYTKEIKQEVKMVWIINIAEVFMHQIQN